MMDTLQEMTNAEAIKEAVIMIEVVLISREDDVLNSRKENPTSTNNIQVSI
jgi:hypothetical protein